MNTNSETVRLVIISVPPEPLKGSLTRLRRELCQLSGSRAALCYPVHLTLRTGAIVPTDLLKDFFKVFGEWVATIPSFSIQLGDLVTTRLPVGNQPGAGACFAGFEIAETAELLQGHSRLAEFAAYRKGPQYDYHPHVTMAFDDLDQRGLDLIRQAVDGRQDLPVGQTWLCQSVGCYRLRGQKWQPAANLPLNPAWMNHG